MQDNPTSNPTSFYTLGTRRFGSERWANMALKLTAELQKQGSEPTFEVITNLTWAACLEAWGAETAHAVDKHCTRKVVGALIWCAEDLLLQQRLTGAIGMAPPAGHREELEDIESACRREVFEETGLDIPAFRLLAEGTRFEKCKRYGSDAHNWAILEATVGDRTLRLAPDESIMIDWYPPFKILELAARTQQYLHLQISETDWKQRPGLEVVWYLWLEELGILQRLRAQAAK